MWEGTRYAGESNFSGSAALHYLIVAIRPRLSKIEFQVFSDIINLASAHTSFCN